MDEPKDLDVFGDRLKGAIAEHSTSDGFWYNALTIAALALSAFSTVAAMFPNWAICVTVASAIATLCIGIERALGLGARWRYHIAMRSAYRQLEDGISWVKNVPEDRKQRFLDNWWATLVAVRKDETQAPTYGIPKDDK